MALKNDNIFCGDCLELMKDIQPKSIDAIICDLPYGVLNRRNHHAQWDRQIPFEPLWKQYKRIIKDDGAIILFSQGMFTADIMKSNPAMWRYNIVWDKVKTTGFLNCNRMPLRRHEDICVFYRKLPTYRPQMEKCAPHERIHSRGEGAHKNKNSCYGTFKETPFVLSDEKYPTSIIRIAKEHRIGQFYHPTQKPVELIRWLIRTYTNEGELILDNCIGGGTTAIAAIRENRHFIGIEANVEYFDIAVERVKREKQSKI